jgi:hypothetical protein
MTVEHAPVSTAQPEGQAFRISLRALVGPSGLPGEESFDFDVCSPDWLETQLDSQAVLEGRFLLIVRDFDPQSIEDYVRRRVEQTSGNDWCEVAGKIARWAHWEFEDYRS